jgi:hypothetical protein
MTHVVTLECGRGLDVLLRHDLTLADALSYQYLLSTVMTDVYDYCNVYEEFFPDGCWPEDCR